VEEEIDELADNCINNSTLPNNEKEE